VAAAPPAASAFASPDEALAMIRDGQLYMAALDPATVTTAAQARYLVQMEQNDSIGTAARAWMLAAFTSGQGPAADADSCARSWLMNKTGVTRGCAAGHVGWSRRVQAHPLVAAALAGGGRLTGSLARLICGYTDKLPAADRDKADAILAGVAAAGCRQPAGACHIHHIVRKADGGRTSVTTCVLLCEFHHLVAVHRWGWTLTLNPDGTTTARSPDGTKILHSHGPPARPG
jgi:hypothetical protein